MATKPLRRAIGQKYQQVLMLFKKIAQKRKIVNSHYAERITVEDMANAATISRTECFRCFKAILNKTPVEYLLEYRLSMASVLLANTDLPLSEVSESCGFHSQSYFGKMFRQQYQISPKKYRSMTAQKKEQLD